MECNLVDVRTLTTILRAIQIAPGKNECISCELSKKGVKFSAVSKAKDLLASCWLPAAAFLEYHFTGAEAGGGSVGKDTDSADTQQSQLSQDIDTQVAPQEHYTQHRYSVAGADMAASQLPLDKNKYSGSESLLEIDIVVSVLIYSLHVFGMTANVHLQYIPTEAAFLLTMVGEAGATTECRMRVYDPDPLRGDLMSSHVQFKPDADTIIMTPSLLAEAFQDLREEEKDTRVLIRIAPTPTSSGSSPVMSLGVTTSYTAVQWDFKYDPHVFHHYNVRHLHKRHYIASSLLLSLRALLIATSVKLTIAEDGLLGLTVLTRAADSSEKFFVEFKLLPATEASEDDHVMTIGGQDEQQQSTRHEGDVGGSAQRTQDVPGVGVSQRSVEQRETAAAMGRENISGGNMGASSGGGEAGSQLLRGDSDLRNEESLFGDPRSMM